MKLKDYLRSKKLSIADFSELIGVDRSTVCRLRKSETKPSWETAQKIFAATGGLVTPNDFLDGLGEADETGT